MRKEVGNLVLDNVPEPSDSLLQVISQFQTSRSSLVCDIVSGGDRSGSILFATRFGETSNIHCIAGPGACREQQTFFSEPVYDALWQPGGKGFAYLKDTGGSEKFSVFYMDMESGLHYPVSRTHKGRCGAILWNEDGSRLCYYSTERNGKDWDIYIVDFGAHNDKHIEISVPRIVFQGEGSWSPMDFYRSRLLLRNFISLEESYLYVMDLNNPSIWISILPGIESKEDNTTKTSISFAKFLKVNVKVEECPIALVSDAGDDFHSLRIHDSLGKPLMRVETNILGDIEELAVANYWSPNISMFAFTVNNRGSFELFLCSLLKDDDRIVPEVKLDRILLQNETVLKNTENVLRNSSLTSLNPSNLSRHEVNASVIRRLRLNASLGVLAFSRYSPVSPGDIYTVQLDTKILRRWTFGEVGGLDRKNFINPYLVEFDSFDGLRIPCWMYLPRSDSKRFPVLIHIHGGPEQQSLPVFTPLFQYLLLEKGLAILDPNVRGSSGYGKRYMSLDDQYRRRDAVKDIGSLLDWIDKQPFLDNERIALLGGSYGGFMVLSSIIEYGNRICAAVDMVGISNFVSYLEGTSAYRRDSRRKEYGDERDPEMRKFLLSISPLTHSQRIHVPLFVAAGKNDPRVPASESEQIVQAVRKNGVECWYMIAKDEGHGYQKKSNRVYWNSLVSMFLDRYLLYQKETSKL
ncbi:hypothetical protein GpartN1_g750.t1 [Galdieria partita]|uniref:Peptidase S9 prolyl oligopeptidase catalytic domain-containing protein n=1 Tax=Galdieria partita TaxID=83374 RepID=A0A9C7PRM5_9RHOD|nr:hypothetical protein GpartN1_g750.t1 [Galdieria partita]